MRVAFEFGRWAFKRDAAGLQHIGIVGNTGRQRDRLLGEQQSQALAMQSAERAIKLLDQRCPAWVKLRLDGVIKARPFFSHKRTCGECAEHA